MPKGAARVIKLTAGPKNQFVDFLVDQHAVPELILLRFPERQEIGNCDSLENDVLHSILLPLDSNLDDSSCVV